MGKDMPVASPNCSYPNAWLTSWLAGMHRPSDTHAAILAASSAWPVNVRERMRVTRVAALLPP